MTFAAAYGFYWSVVQTQKHRITVTALHKASLRCDTDIISIILNHGADVDAQDNGGSTPLHLIFDAGPRDAAEQAIGVLLEHCANTNLRNHEGQTALHKSSQCDDIDIMHLILKHGPDVNAMDNNGSTPLHLAISDSSLWHAKQVVGQEHCSNISIRNHVGLLLDQGANINIRDHEGQTALHKASQCYDIDIMHLILKHGPDVKAFDNNGLTPLHLAISDTSPWYAKQAIGLLLEHGANINIRNHEGQTALHKASRRDDIDTMHLILKHGPDVNALDNNGSTPLHLAISDDANCWNVERAVRLLEHGPDVNALDNNGSTTPHLVISYAYANSWHIERAVGLLLEHGANINLRNGQGLTALHKASLRGYPNIMHLILNHGADVDAQDNDDSTPLHLIISKVSMDSEAFEDSKASVDSEPLREVIKLLLEHGASGQRENNRGDTPFQVAAVRGLHEITGLLSMHIQKSERTA